MRMTLSRVLFCFSEFIFAGLYFLSCAVCFDVCECKVAKKKREIRGKQAPHAESIGSNKVGAADLILISTNTKAGGRIINHVFPECGLPVQFLDIWQTNIQGLCLQLDRCAFGYA